jgi:integrase
MPGRQTIEKYLLAWHETKAFGADSTRLQYKGIIANHLVPVIGAVRLTSLTPDHIRKMLREAEKAGKGDRTIKYMMQVLHAALEDGVRERKLEWNPASAVRVREARPQQKKLLDWGQLADFLEAARASRFHAAYVLMAACALRPGEVLALKWSGLDWQRGTLRVAEALSKREKGWQLRPRTKTGAVAVMPLAAAVVEVLREHRILQMAEAVANAEIWRNDDDLIFTMPDGRYADPDFFRREFAKWAPAGVVPYSLRHSVATYSLADGEDIKTVQGLLRHGRASTTLNSYAHAVDQVQRDSANRRAERLLG